MKLKRFNKNRKQKEILIGSIVGILLIIGGISLYRTFALYKEEKSFNVLRGKVPDFSGGDIILAYTVDGQPSSTLKSFPNRNSGYVVNKVECENKVEAEWDNYNWSLENIKNPSEAKQIKCTIDFTSGYKETLLAGTDPVLKGDLIPVKIDPDNGKVTKANPSLEWYRYADKKWANAIIPTSEAKAAIEQMDYDEEITDTQIESYFVWIPKYSYRLFDDKLGKYNTADGVKEKGTKTAIEIRFGMENTTDNEEKEECKTPMLSNEIQGASGESGSCAKGRWMTHPAFLAFNTTGFWMGKFESGYKNATSTGGARKNVAEPNSLVIKPNQYAWTLVSVGNAYKTALGYRKELQSHLIKNTEWGAAAYLTQSIYGMCASDYSCKEVTINSNTSYMTGYSGASTAYTTVTSKGASSTANYTGIYDMSGGAIEYTASFMTSAKVISDSMIADFNWTSYGLEEKDYNPMYFDLYLAGTATEWNRRILGDATGEMGPFEWYDSGYRGSWYGDRMLFVYSTNPWFSRGGHSDESSPSGIFYGIHGSGGGDTRWGFRVTLAVQ